MNGEPFLAGTGTDDDCDDFEMWLAVFWVSIRIMACVRETTYVRLGGCSFLDGVEDEDEEDDESPPKAAFFRDCGSASWTAPCLRLTEDIVSCMIGKQLLVCVVDRF